jgi:hypothetical protein
MEDPIKGTVDNLWTVVDNFTDQQKVQSKRQNLPLGWQKLPLVSRI